MNTVFRILAALGLAGAACINGSSAAPEGKRVEKGSYPVSKSAEEWKKSLSPEQYRVLREKGTERAFTGAYWDKKEPGLYKCAGCGQVLFDAATKYDSGSGWPSFHSPAADRAVATETDKAYGMVRTEVHCSRCGGHLGHVFDDGPAPTGMRYCINSASLAFEPKE